MHDAAEAPRPTMPPAFLLHDRRRVARRRDEPADPAAVRERRAVADRRQGPDDHLWDALVMLDDLTRLAEAGSDTHRLIAGAARRMWLALAEFRRGSGAPALEAWLAERQAG